jgi:ABC-type Fe3+ transport system substrate-binding protein
MKKTERVTKARQLLKEVETMRADLVKPEWKNKEIAAVLTDGVDQLEEFALTELAQCEALPESGA